MRWKDRLEKETREVTRKVFFCCKNKIKLCKNFPPFLQQILLVLNHFFNLTFCPIDIFFKLVLHSNLLYHQLSISLACHSVNLLFHQLAISSTCNFITLSFHQLVISSTCSFINLPFCQLAISSTCHFINFPFHQTVKLM